MEAQAVEPAFGIFAGDPDVAPGELLVVGCVAISFQACLDKCAFFGGEPADAFRIVRDEPVCDDGDENCEETFLVQC